MTYTLTPSARIWQPAEHADTATAAPVSPLEPAQGALSFLGPGRVAMSVSRGAAPRGATSRGQGGSRGVRGERVQGRRRRRARRTAVRMHLWQRLASNSRVASGARGAYVHGELKPVGGGGACSQGARNGTVQ